VVRPNGAPTGTAEHASPARPSQETDKRFLTPFPPPGGAAIGYWGGRAGLWDPIKGMQWGGLVGGVAGGFGSAYRQAASGGVRAALRAGARAAAPEVIGAVGGAAVAGVLGRDPLHGATWGMFGVGAAGGIGRKWQLWRQTGRLSSNVHQTGKIVQNKVTTPNAAARAKSQGAYVDPLTNRVVKTTDTLAADHIFPNARIRKLPGFDRLTSAQQSEVLNNLENFRGLPQSLNASKGSRIDWSMYRGRPLDPQYAKELADLQQVMKTELQAQIDALLGGRR